MNAYLKYLKDNATNFTPVQLEVNIFNAFTNTLRIDEYHQNIKEVMNSQTLRQPFQKMFLIFTSCNNCSLINSILTSPDIDLCDLKPFISSLIETRILPVNDIIKTVAKRKFSKELLEYYIDLSREGYKEATWTFWHLIIENQDVAENLELLKKVDKEKYIEGDEFQKNLRRYAYETIPNINDISYEEYNSNEYSNAYYLIGILEEFYSSRDFIK